MGMTKKRREKRDVEETLQLLDDVVVHDAGVAATKSNGKTLTERLADREG